MIRLILQLMCLQVRYMISKDPEFAMQGSVTKFDYFETFKIYKEAATILKDTIRGREIINSWNEFVFEGVGITDEAPATVNMAAATSVLDRLRAQREADAEDSS